MPKLYFVGSYPGVPATFISSSLERPVNVTSSSGIFSFTLPFFSPAREGPSPAIGCFSWSTVFSFTSSRSISVSLFMVGSDLWSNNEGKWPVKLIYGLLYSIWKGATEYLIWISSSLFKFHIKTWTVGQGSKVNVYKGY